MKKELWHIAKILRKRLTDAEKRLWRHLSGKQLEGFKFRRQEPIGRYVGDFACYEKRILVEVDGGQHTVEKDRDRERWLEGQGFKVLRFWNNDVLNNIQGGTGSNKKALLISPSPNPSHQGRGS